MYEHLFESDSAGDQCKFAEAVREQSLWEYNELVADLQTAMVRARYMLRACSAATAPDTCALRAADCPREGKEHHAAADSLQRRDDGAAGAAGGVRPRQRGRRLNRAGHNGGGDVVVARGGLQVVRRFSAGSHRQTIILPSSYHHRRFIRSLRVPPKFAESVMLSAFQARTGQKFPRTPLPVFEVVQELRKVRDGCAKTSCTHPRAHRHFLLLLHRCCRCTSRATPSAQTRRGRGGSPLKPSAQRERCCPALR